eukprot:34018_1
MPSSNNDMEQLVRNSVQQNIVKDRNEVTDDTTTTSSSVELAIKMSMKKKPSTVDTRTGELVPYQCCSFKLLQFQQFGVGIYLYFKFLKQLTKLFLVLFILSLPLFLSSLGSGKLEKTPMMFEQTSIGNLGESTEYERIHVPSYIPLSFLNNFDFLDFDDETNSFAKQDAGIVFAWSDLIGTLIFLVFLIYVRFNNKKEAQATDEANTTVSDYTVCITGLPKDCYNREELQHHFQNKNDYGQVVDVAICYNDTGIIKKYIEKSSVMERYQSAIKKEEKKKKITALEKKAKKVGKQISKIKRRYSKHCICAYVTFNDAESVKKVLYDYPDTFLARLCMKKTLKFRHKYRVKVSRAAEPSEIMYDNMKYSKCNVFLRRSFTFILSFVAIAVSCSMSLFAATYRQKHLQLSKDALDCPQLEDPLTELHNLNLEDTEYDVDCLCSQLSASQMYDEYELCSDYLTNMSISNALIGGSAAIIIVINLALKFISRCLVNFEKHTSLTKMERELTWKMFVGLFFNTALIILCVNAKFESLNLMFLFEGEYEDFEPEWYQVVGVSLLLTMIMNIANPHLIPIVMYPFQRCSLWCKVRKIKSQTASGTNQYTQRELNAMFEGVAFTLAERYAIICNTIYVSFFYASGMPVLLLLASITFWVTYYCDKFVILKRAKTPPKYNADVAQFTLQLIKPIIYIHLAVSIWVYGSETVMLHHPLGADPTASATADADIGYAENFRGKVLNYSCLPSFLALVLLITFDVVRNILTTFKLTQCAASIARKFLLCFCPCCCKKCLRNENAIHVQEDIDLYLNEVSKGMRFESYLASFQELYENAYFDQEMAADTKGLLLKEEPLYVKQNLIAANKNKPLI